MRHRLADREPTQPAVDVAMIRIDRLNALASPLAIEDVVKHSRAFQHLNKSPYSVRSKTGLTPYCA